MTIYSKSVNKFPILEKKRERNRIRHELSQPIEISAQSNFTSESMPSLDEKLLSGALLEKTKKTSPYAIQYFRQLFSQAYSDPLKYFLASLNTPKEYSLENFITGVQSFIQIANKNYSARESFYGNSFLGLHYNNDLAEYWNKEHSEKIRSDQLYSLCPNEWEFLDLECLALVYKGDKPSQALDKLIQGPTVVDCGQFCQLSIWFGIRYMLGDDELFNQLFGKTPLYITQLSYRPIENPLKPVGNPLYPFFQKVNISEVKTSAVYITHVANHTDYVFKHPGDNYGGDNCILMNGEYAIFDPSLKKTLHLTREEVEKLLREAFDAKPNEHDQNRLDLYGEDPALIHDKFGMRHQTLIGLARLLANKQLYEKDWQSDSPKRDQSTLLFDFEKFYAWVKKNKTPILTAQYTPYTEEKLHVPLLLTQQLPHENRHTMSFSTFKTDSALHKKMHQAAIKFCADVMKAKSCCMIFSGKAGIGKTALAVCCAKELISRGKQVLWISEVTVKGWMQKATSIADLATSQIEIQSLLARDPDVVFLDDDNIVGHAGEVLLEAIYAWYVTHPGKGLLITSNVAVNFEKCYGFKLEGTIPPPFLDYTSEQYENTIILSSLNGGSLRPQPDFKIAELSDEQKIDALLSCNTESSIGIVISHESYRAEERFFNKDVEYIPAFDSEVLAAVRRSLTEKHILGPDYEKINPEHRKWLKQFEREETYLWRNGKYEIRPACPGIAVKIFEKTDRAFIVVEIKSYFSFADKENQILPDCVDQILSVINYAHDQGGKKVIIINRTTFNHAMLLEKIKKEINHQEKERTISRMDTLLFSPCLRAVSQPVFKKTEIRKPSKDQTQYDSDFGIEYFDYNFQGCTSTSIGAKTSNDILPETQYSSSNALISGYSPSLFSSKQEETKEVKFNNKKSVEALLTEIFKIPCTLLAITETRQEIKFTINQSFQDLETYSNVLLKLNLDIRLIPTQSLIGGLIKNPGKIEILHSLTEISRKLALSVDLNKKLTVNYSQ